MVEIESSGWRRRRSGQGFAELAIIMPILIFLFLAMMEIGFWAQSWLTVATAAREGARYASRGFHVSASEIAEIATVVMSGSLDVELSGPEANARVIVTQVDIEADGSYAVHDVYMVGDLPVSSSVCLDPPCSARQIDLYGARLANSAFNAEVEFCEELTGCRADIIVVEAIYSHRLMAPVPMITDYLSNRVTINGRSAMRMLYRRSAP
ncbi:MAG: pilus assembly protein [Anaerolineales bacterium]